MVWGLGFILTLAVVVFVGYPLFSREAVPVEDSLELAIAQRRGKAKGAAAATRGRGKTACPRCGAANLPQDRFCARCGTELALTCPACGNKYDAGDLFCASCGAKLAGRQ